jgi:RNA polymerase sigma-32 factor
MSIASMNIMASDAKNPLVLNNTRDFASDNKLIKSSDRGFFQYLQQIKKFPILTAEEEFEYGTRFAKTGDKEAAKMLVQSHLRLVVKMATKFKNYGLPIFDLVSEGNLGLIQAVKKFDPQKGFRFSTYAMWWIRAYIQDYVLRSWSLVKIGTTVAQKKLFFNLNKVKKRLGISSSISPNQATQIANALNVTEKEVAEMDSRLSQSDTSLNNLVSEDDDAKEVLDLMASNDDSQEILAIQNQEKSRQQLLFKKALATLNEREKDILIKRQMSEDSMTLEDLSQIYKISRERVRQIEENAIRKIKKAVSA